MLSESKLNEMRNDKKKEYRKEMGTYVELFMAFSHQQS